MVTARGRPSGMATTMMVTAMMKASTTPEMMVEREGLVVSCQIMATSATKVSTEMDVPSLLQC